MIVVQMKRLVILLALTISLSAFGQERVYTAGKGLKFVPGHLHAVVTVGEKSLRYELFDHWYSGMYIDRRQMVIPIEQLNEFGVKNDTLEILVLKNRVHIRDKRFHLNKNIKQGGICASAGYMRKVSFAGRISEKHGLGPRALFNHDDLEKLTEDEFKAKVTSNAAARL